MVLNGPKTTLPDISERLRLVVQRNSVEWMTDEAKWLLTSTKSASGKLIFTDNTDGESTDWRFVAYRSIRT
jgi:hypothetical protein